MTFEQAVKNSVKRYHDKISGKLDDDPMENKKGLFDNYEKSRGKKVRYNGDFFNKMNDKFSMSKEEDKS